MSTADFEPSPKKGTSYLVLSKTPEAGGNVYRRVATVNAVSAKAAIKRAATGAGTFVAVPERSFQPVTVSVKTVEKVTFE